MMSGGSVSMVQNSASSPIVMMNSMTPSPRAPSASSSPHPFQQQSQHHTPTASPSPQHFLPQSRTPPVSCQSSAANLPQQHQPSPKPHQDGGNQQQYGQCYDMIERLKNRVDRYRSHHEIQLQKEHTVMGQSYMKMKMETTRLRKQMVANESSTGNKSKKNSAAAGNAASIGGTGSNTGTTPGSRARNGGGVKRSAAAAALGSPANVQGMVMGGAGAAGGTTTTGASGVTTGTGRAAKVPKMTAKQRKLLKQQQQQQQQQMDSQMQMPNSQLLLNSTPTPPSSTTNNPQQPNGPGVGGGCSGSSVYKFNPNSPIDIKPQLHLISNNNSGNNSTNGPVNHHLHGHHSQPMMGSSNGASGGLSSYQHPQQQHHNQQIKQELDMSPYFESINVDAIQDILDSSNIPADDSDSKDIINELLGSESGHSTPTISGSTQHQFGSDSNLMMNGGGSLDFSDSGFGTDDTLVSNRFGDEDFITKFLKDLDNDNFNTTAACSSSSVDSNMNQNMMMMNGGHMNGPLDSPASGAGASFTFNHTNQSHSNPSSLPSTPTSSHGSVNSPGLMPPNSTTTSVSVSNNAQMNQFGPGSNIIGAATSNSQMFSMRQTSSSSSSSPLPSINTIAKGSHLNNNSRSIVSQVPNSAGGSFSQQQHHINQHLHHQSHQQPHMQPHQPPHHSHQMQMLQHISPGPDSPFDSMKNAPSSGPSSMSKSNMFNTCAPQQQQQQQQLPKMMPSGARPNSASGASSNLLLQPVALMNQGQSPDHKMSSMISMGAMNRASNTPSPHHSSVSPNLMTPNAVGCNNNNTNPNGPNASVKLKQIAQQQQQNKQPWNSGQQPNSDFYQSNSGSTHPSPGSMMMNIRGGSMMTSNVNAPVSHQQNIRMVASSGTTCMQNVTTTSTSLYQSNVSAAPNQSPNMVNSNLPPTQQFPMNKQRQVRPQVRLEMYSNGPQQGQMAPASGNTQPVPMGSASNYYKVQRGQQPNSQQQPIAVSSYQQQQQQQIIRASQHQIRPQQSMRMNMNNQQQHMQQQSQMMQQQRMRFNGPQTMQGPLQQQQQMSYPNQTSIQGPMQQQQRFANNNQSYWVQQQQSGPQQNMLPQQAQCQPGAAPQSFSTYPNSSIGQNAPNYGGGAGSNTGYYG